MGRMENDFDIAERTPIWIALSKFYLDTELQSYEFRYIAKVIKESRFSLAEVKIMNSYEVFPVLWKNSITVAGVSSGFDEQWLVKEIIVSLKKRNRIKDFFLRFWFNTYKRYFTEYWECVDAYADKD